MYEFCDRLVDELARVDVLHAHRNGIANPYVPALSPADNANHLGALVELQAQLGKIDRSSSADNVAATVAAEELARLIQWFESDAPTVDLNTIASPWQGCRESLDCFTPLSDQDALTQLSGYVAGLPTSLRGYRETLAEGLAAGRVASRRTVEACIRQGRQAAGTESSINQALARWVDDFGADAVQAARLPEAAADLRAAYGEVTEWLEATYLPQARTADGVGRDAYVAAVRNHLGTELDLEDTYVWGWSLLHRELKELAAACAAIDPSRSVADVVGAVDSDPSQLAADAQAFVDAIQESQDAAIAELAGRHFLIDPRIRTIEVRWSPPGGSLAAQCIPASEDFSKPGTIQWPVYGLTNIPIARELTTAYHEGVPGHHLQCNYARLLDQPLSRVHASWVWSPGLGEGWALYAEQFMDDLGALPPNARIGFVLSKLLRTFRVVCDIGTHLDLPIPDDAPQFGGQQWTFDRAKKLMADVTFEREAVVESELERYFSWPAQAISYKIGEQRIFDWRSRWVDQGSETLAEFHHRVLCIGSPGLDVAEELMEHSA